MEWAKLFSSGRTSKLMERQINMQTEMTILGKGDQSIKCKMDGL